jgi:hypothetical protein
MANIEQNTGVLKNETTQAGPHIPGLSMQVCLKRVCRTAAIVPIVPCIAPMSLA